MTEPVTIIGNYLSPYVRKVLVILDRKGIEYRIDPLIPFYGDERFDKVSPIRRIPVLLDGEVTITDSTVIAEYLEETHPSPRMLPERPQDRARARWLEEFADTRMGDVFIWHFYNQLVIRRFVWQKPPDEAVLAKAKNEEIPSVLDFLEGQVPNEGFFFGDSSMTADVAVAAMFRNAAFARFEIDGARWPKTKAYVERVLSLESFTKLVPFETKMLKTPIPQHREALKEIGAPLTETTLITDKPRASMMIE